MSMKDLPPDLRQEGCAVIGSLIALLFTDAIWPRKVAYFLGGWALSKIFGDTIQGLIGTSLETARALTALFGLAVVEKMFDVIYSLDTKRMSKSLTDAVVRRFRGN